MPIKRIILTLDTETEEKVRKKAKELHYSTVQRYIYDLIRKDILKDKKPSLQNPSDPPPLSLTPSLTQNSLQKKSTDDIENDPQSNQKPSPLNIDLQIASISSKLISQFPDLALETLSFTEPQRKKLPSELILEHIEKEAERNDTIRKLREIEN